MVAGNAANQSSFVSFQKPSVYNNANLGNLVSEGRKEMLIVFKELVLVVTLGQANTLSDLNTLNRSQFPSDIVMLFFFCFLSFFFLLAY